jgi:hypothetical protein
MVLIKVPDPDPLPVLVASDTVGFGDMLQTTPRAVTVAPPSCNISPPEATDDAVMEDAAVVVKRGLIDEYPVTQLEVAPVKAKLVRVPFNTVPVDVTRLVRVVSPVLDPAAVP